MFSLKNFLTQIIIDNIIVGSVVFAVLSAISIFSAVMIPIAVVGSIVVPITVTIAVAIPVTIAIARYADLCIIQDIPQHLNPCLIQYLNILKHSVKTGIILTNYEYKTVTFPGNCRGISQYSGRRCIDNNIICLLLKFLKKPF